MYIMAKITLICGLIGAGKSTQAFKLEKTGQVRFAIDEWMVCLYRADQTDTLDYPWMLERIERAENQIWALAQQLLKIDISVILDLGFLKQDHRQKFYDLAAAENFKIETLLIEADKGIRWQRTSRRNEEKGDSFSLIVTREMFDFCEDLFERPEGGELEKCKVIQN